MNDAVGAVAARTTLLQEGKGPRDDFFCWKFRIWYPSEDCTYRHTHRTYHGCAGCFQGRMNQRHLEKGLRAPVILSAPAREGA